MNLLVKLLNCLNKPLPLHLRTASYCQFEFSNYVLFLSTITEVHD